MKVLAAVAAVAAVWGALTLAALRGVAAGACEGWASGAEE